MKKITHNNSLDEMIEGINRDLYDSKLLNSFSLLFPDVEYQGTALTIKGGNYFDTTANTNVYIADTVLTLTPSSSNFIYVDKSDNSIKVQPTNAGLNVSTVYVLYDVVLNEFEEIDSVVDYRAWLRF